MSTRTASCSCGAVRITLRGEPVRVSMCHCLACQRRTGSAFGVQARFARDRVESIEGPASEWTRVGDAGGRITFRFCPTCGATVWWELDSIPGFVAVAVGAFADPSFPSPKVAVYEARRHAWAVMPELVVDHFE